MGGRVLERLRRRRALVVAAIHIFLAALAYYIAYALRVDSGRPWKNPYGHFFFRGLPVLLTIRFGVFLAFDLFRGMWRYVSISDLRNIVLSVTLGSVLYAPIAVFLLPRNEFSSNSVLVLDWAFCILLLGGVRFAIRAFRETFLPMREGRRVLIVGAGDAGEMLLREIKTHQHLGYLPVGFVDDDPQKHGMKIHDIPVLAGTDSLARIVEREAVDEVIVAIPTATGRQLQRILALCEDLPVRIRKIPTAGDIIRLTQLRDVDVEDLLEREPVHLEEERIRDGLRGRRVLVTGAGGSIGSELVRQIAGFGPERICLLDWSENSLFFLERELLDHYPDLSFEIRVADIRDRERVEQTLAEGRYHHVYHAAAFKHVPLMESNPVEAVKNNVHGTRVLAECALATGVQKLVLISTDKAVRPTSVMGASKRAAELMLSVMPRDGTQFLSVRFGNVLGSQGSVIPLFRQQIRKGGPVTVTDPEVVRYFMTIPEAVQLVLQAGAMGQGGEVFLLDMGEPVKIDELARRLISLSGFRPDEDIPITYVGLRPGEKLFEELLVEAEDAVRTEHEKIWIVNGEPPEGVGTSRLIGGLLAASERGDANDVIRALGDLVPEYRPNNPEWARVLGRDEAPVE